VGRKISRDPQNIRTKKYEKMVDPAVGKDTGEGEWLIIFTDVTIFQIEKGGA